MLGKIACALGFHKYMDLQRVNETIGQSAVQECVRCGKAESVFRLAWAKDGPMHPRVRRC